jgi:hypothetical protein
MRHFIKALTALAIALPVMAKAGDDLVVVELFTSQGCSSCPPADEVLAELATNPGILPLAFHVDYWDYLGWKDELGSAANTDRQRAYAAAWGERMIYTPQAVVNGVDQMVGSNTQAVTSAIMAHMNQPALAEVSVTRAGGKLTISGKGLGALEGPIEVLLVRYTPDVSVDILHGENAGSTVRYVNTVTSVTSVGQWNGSGPLAMKANISGNDEAAILLQRANMGQVVAAALVP